MQSIYTEFLAKVLFNPWLKDYLFCSCRYQGCKSQTLTFCVQVYREERSRPQRGLFDLTVWFYDPSGGPCIFYREHYHLQTAGWTQQGLINGCEANVITFEMFPHHHWTVGTVSINNVWCLLSVCVGLPVTTHTELSLYLKITQLQNDCRFSVITWDWNDFQSFSKAFVCKKLIRVNSPLEISHTWVIIGPNLGDVFQQWNTFRVIPCKKKWSALSLILCTHQEEVD